MQRREFLKGSALAGVGLAFSRAHTWAQAATDCRIEVLLNEPIPQFAKMSDVHALIIGHEHKRRFFYFLRELGNDAGLFWSHIVDLGNCRSYTVMYGDGSR